MIGKPAAGLAVAIALAVAAAAGAPAGAVVVDLTVESSTAPAPLFAGPVSTSPHAVDGSDGSGAHPCWGAGASPAPTATGALDDGMRTAGISWRGNWNPSFRDFFVDRIGPHSSAAPDHYWSLSVNGRFSAGGCLATVADGDTVRFFYGPLFGTPPRQAPGAAGGAEVEAGGPDSVPSTPARADGAAVARIARRAARFLRGRSGPREMRRPGSRAIGGDWAELALALRSRRRPVGAALRLGERLRSLPGGGPRIGEDVDATALAAWALALRGRGARAREAAIFVRSAQAADGGFPTAPGGTSNAQSTGVALIALRVAGLGPRPSARPGGPTPLDYLASLARPDGAIAYVAGSNPAPVWTTAQALLGLTAKEKLMQVDTLPPVDE